MDTINNYKFITNFNSGLTEEKFLEVMRNNDMSSIFYHDDQNNCSFCTAEGNVDEPEYRAIFILEKGYVDIEMNLLPSDDLKPIIDYCICANYNNGIGWGTDGFYDEVVYSDDAIKIDFNKSDWKEQVKEDMLEKLEKYCKVKGYDYTKPIKY